MVRSQRGHRVCCSCLLLTTNPYWKPWTLLFTWCCSLLHGGMSSRVSAEAKLLCPITSARLQGLPIFTTPREQEQEQAAVVAAGMFCL
ncbi:hypothetical protein COO60DRAFT_452183 [Scenedesmus sp. NREL 46B-D3]|nr:hypothetical protein COO60DRAFT_452183 [Scenedesmus sp. NREL 46B-D3]